MSNAGRANHQSINTFISWQKMYVQNVIIYGVTMLNMFLYDSLQMKIKHIWVLLYLHFNIIPLQLNFCYLPFFTFASHICCQRSCLEPRSLINIIANLSYDQHDLEVVQGDWTDGFYFSTAPRVLRILFCLLYMCLCLMKMFHIDGAQLTTLLNLNKNFTLKLFSHTV